MAYTPIPGHLIEVGKANIKDLWDKLLGNLADHEDRLNALSVGSGPVILFNEEIENISPSLPLNGLRTYKAFSGIQITKAQIQIFTKDGIASGAIEIDLKKSSTLGGAFTSIFTTKPSINYATSADYDAADGVFNSGQTILQNEIVRLDITSVPAGKVIKKIRILVFGVLT